MYSTCSITALQIYRLTPSSDVVEYWHCRTEADPLQLGSEGYMLDIALMIRPGVQPPFLAVWGLYELALLPAGAEAFRRDLTGDR